MYIASLSAHAGKGSTSGFTSHGMCKLTATVSDPNDASTASTATHETACWDNFDGKLIGAVEWPATPESPARFG